MALKYPDADIFEEMNYIIIVVVFIVIFILYPFVAEPAYYIVSDSTLDIPTSPHHFPFDY